MNRRSMLGRMTVAGLGATLPSKIINAAAIPAGMGLEPYIPFKKFKMGALEMIILTDGYLEERPVQPGFAANIPAEQVKQLLEENFRSTEVIELGMQIMLIRKGTQLIMLDAGYGAAVSTTGLLLNALKSANINPAAITDIVISHAHPDHIGGLFTKEDQLVFKNAKLHISATEYDFWMKAVPADFINSGLKAIPDFLKEILRITRKHLELMKPSLSFFKEDTPLFGFIELIAAPGHTPGLTLMKISDGNEKLIYIADLVHSDILLFPHPEWTYFGDTDQPKAAATRKTMLEKLAAEKIKVFAYHLPWPGLGHVRKKNEGFEWIPEVYAKP